MASVTIGSTFDLAASWREVLRLYTPKAIAQRIGASPRTIDNWRDGENGPTWKYTVAMLNDAELAPRLLEAAGRHDLARVAEIEALNQRIEALKAEEQKHREWSDEFQRDLAMGRRRGGVAVGPAQQGDGPVAQGRGVVPGSDRGRS